MIYCTGIHSVCVDCVSWLANGDATGLDYHYSEKDAKKRFEEIKQGERAMIEAFGSIHVGEEQGFTTSGCDCCGSTLAGNKHTVQTYIGEPINVRNDIPYLDARFILYSFTTQAPRHNSASGYGKKIPTRFKVACADGKNRRVYVTQYSNVGSAWIVFKGERLYLGADVELVA